MLHHGNPFRLFVTLLLVVAVPFCCCDFRTLLNGRASCRAASGTDGDETVSLVESIGTAHDDGASHQHATGHDAENGENHSPTPCGPGHDKHDCICGKNDGKMQTVHKSTVELPTPVVVAVLDWTLAADLIPRATSPVPYREMSASNRLPTSLLGMHCALIV